MADFSPTKTPYFELEPGDIERARTLIGRGLNLAHLSCSLAAEVVEVVARMHGTISRLPGPVGRLRNDAAFGIAGLVYRLIRGSFDHLDHGFAEAGRALNAADAPSDARWLLFQAALNGVLGDRLTAQDSPLALGMSLHRTHSSPLSAPQRATHQVIFLHGLCMSELGWHNPAHFALCQRLSASPENDIAYLRYNSGLHISDNGKALSQLLETNLAAHQSLSLIGHSMGGLLIRSALHAAEIAGHRWPQRLSNAAMLGSPHHGAPLERIGNWANRLLKVSPYMAPLSRLGDLRSAGIRDLRFGNLTRGDWSHSEQIDHTEDLRQPLNLPPGPRYLLIAASLSSTLPKPATAARHDYLVPVRSALGLADEPQWQLSAPQLQREVLADTNHMQLLDDPRVHALLDDWLN